MVLGALWRIYPASGSLARAEWRRRRWDTCTPHNWNLFSISTRSPFLLSLLLPRSSQFTDEKRPVLSRRRWDLWTLRECTLRVQYAYFHLFGTRHAAIYVTLHYAEALSFWCDFGSEREEKRLRLSSVFSSRVLYCNVSRFLLEHSVNMTPSEMTCNM